MVNQVMNINTLPNSTQVFGNPYPSMAVVATTRNGRAVFAVLDVESDAAAARTSVALIIK